MQRKLTITLDAAIYEGLHTVIGRRKISQFIADLVRPHVVLANLEAGYLAMAADDSREADAVAWIEGVLGDSTYETR